MVDVVASPAKIEVLLWDVPSSPPSSLSLHNVVGVTHQCFPISRQGEKETEEEEEEEEGTKRHEMEISERRGEDRN